MPERPNDRFAALQWASDRVTLDGWLFLFQHDHAPDVHATDHFMFYKLEPMMADYAAFFRSRPGFKAHTLLEVGMWDGGSLALWMDLLDPDRAVGVDLATTGDSAYFTQFIDSRGLRDRVTTHWGVNQNDSARLLEVLADHRDTLNLVIDDASHLYEPTLQTFETLFPLLEPGGLYIIEDWAWEHWADYSGPDAIWGDQRPMADLIHDLVRLAATGPIASVTVFKDFVVVERDQSAAVPTPFSVSEQIVVRKTPLLLRRRARRLAGRARRALRRAIGVRKPG